MLMSTLSVIPNETIFTTNPPTRPEGQRAQRTQRAMRQAGEGTIGLISCVAGIGQIVHASAYFTSRREDHLSVTSSRHGKARPQCAENDFPL